MRRVLVTSCSVVTEAGFGRPGRLTTWASAGTTFTKPRWSCVSPHPCPHIGRLDLALRRTLLAAELLGLGVAGGDVPLRPVAIVLVARHGSQAVDAAFVNSTSAIPLGSPAIFPYTLPSAAIGEIAIRYRLGGSSICFVGEPDPVRLALWEGTHLIASGEEDTCVCLTYDAPPVEHLLDGGSRDDAYNGTGTTYAFLLEADENRPKAASTDRVAAIDLVRAAPVVGPGTTETTWLSELCSFLEGDANSPAGLTVGSPAATKSERAMVFRVADTQQ